MDESTFQTQLLEKDAKISELEKKIRLNEFKVKKQIQELQCAGETDKVKLSQALSDVTRTQDLLKQFQQKAEETENKLVALQEEKIDLQSKNEQLQMLYDELNEKLLSLSPRKKSNESIDIDELPSYQELQTKLTSQEQDMEDKISHVQNTALQIIVEKDAKIEELQNQKLEQDQRLVDMDTKINQLHEQIYMLQEQNQIISEKGSIMGNEQSLLKFEEEKQQYIEKIKQLGDQIYHQQYEFEEQINTIEHKLKEEYFNKTKDFELNSNKLILIQHEHIMDQIYDLEEKLKDKDGETMMLKEKLSKAERDLNYMKLENNNELSSIDMKLEQQKEDYEKQIEETKKENESQVVRLKREIDDLNNELGFAQKKYQKLESERNRLQENIKRVKEEQEAEIGKKNEQLTQCIDEYEQKIKELKKEVKGMKNQKASHQKAVSEIETLYKTRLQDQLEEVKQKQSEKEEQEEDKGEEKAEEQPQSMSGSCIQGLIQREAFQQQVEEEESNRFEDRILVLNEKLNETVDQKNEMMELYQMLVENVKEDLFKQICQLKQDMQIEHQLAQMNFEEVLSKKLEESKIQQEKRMSDELKAASRRSSQRRDSSLQLGLDILTLQREVKDCHQRERDSLLKIEKLQQEISNLKSEHLIALAETNAKINLLQQEADYAQEEQKYAEEVAQRAQLNLAMIMTEKDQNHFKFKKAIKELAEYQKQFGKLKK